MSAKATRVASGSAAPSKAASSFPSGPSVLASSSRDDDAKGAGRSRHARFRRGRSDAAPLPTQRWHARTFAPGDARGARLRAADLVDRTPPPRICRGRNADAAPRAETFAIALARARQCAPRRAKHARRVRFFVFASLRIPNTQTADCSPYEIVSVVLRHWPLQLGSKSRSRVVRAPVLPAVETIESEPACSAEGRRAARRDPSTGRGDGPSQ